jgi:hypothetical protein
LSFLEHINIYKIKKTNIIMVHKFLITSAQASYTIDKDGVEIPFGSKTGLKKGKAKPNRNFLSGLEKLADNEGAELMILPIAGRCSKEDILHEEIEGHNAIRNNSLYRLNKNIQVRDIVVPPQNKDPTTGKRDLVGQYGSSIIFPHSKQRYQAVPTFNSGLPRYLYTPGAVTMPNYDTSNHRGDTAEREHVFGALMVEVLDEEHYNIRNIRALKNGKFVDLGIGYNGNNNMEKVGVDSMVLGDYHWGNHDEQTINANYEMIKQFNPKRVFIHDFFDGYSVNHHERRNLMGRSREMKNGRLSLEEELISGAEELNRLGRNFRDTQFYIVSSNHNAFLPRYINDGEWLNRDIWNSEIGSYLYYKSLNANIPEREIDDAALLLEYGYLRYCKLPNNINFSKLTDSIRRHSFQLASHGDKGSSGARAGSAKSRAVTGGGKSITGHTHAMEIYGNTYIVGTSSRLDQKYTAGYGNSTIGGNAILYNNGLVQMLPIIKGRWKSD